MPSGFLLAILCGLGAMLGWGLADFFAKKTIDRLGDVETLFWGQLLGIVPLALLFAARPDVPQLTSFQWAYIAFLGVWSGLSYIPTYMAFGKGKISLLSPLFASYAVVVTILSAVLLHEIIPPGRIGAFALVFAGIVLVSGDPRAIWSWILGRKRDATAIAGTREIAFAIVLYSLWLIALDRFLNGRYWVPILLGIRLFSAASLYIYVRAMGRKIAINDRALWKYLVLIGLFDVAAFSFVSFGYSVTSYVSVITMLSGAFSLPTIVLARVFLKERTTMTQTAGSLFIVAGVMLLPFL